MQTLIRDAVVHSGREAGFQGGILITEGKIEKVLKSSEITELDTKDMQIVSGEGLHLMPGLIDVHLHGSYGYDFIREPQAAIDHVAEGLVREGTTSFLASLTVVSHRELCALLKSYSQAEQPGDGAEFLGVHSEGPYLSKEYKALMDETYLRDPSLKEMEEMVEAGKGCLKVMTFAPERKGAEELLSAFKNITFMIGHSAAACGEAMAALAGGAKGFTHLYNAMSQHLHRDPGCVTAALIDDKAFCELIVDGFHVHRDVVRAAWKNLGAERIVLITDAMLGKGMEDGSYVFSNLECEKRGNTVQVKATGRIAGSAVTMLDAVRNMHAFCGCNFDELVQMACVNPSVEACVHERKGTLEPGKDADMILLDDDFRLVRTFVRGKEVYHSIRA